VQEHLRALRCGHFDGQYTIGLVGNAADRRIAQDVIGSQIDNPVTWVEADDGYEQVTLQALYTWLHQTPGEFAILYAHTKGAHRQNEHEDGWRRLMTRELVTTAPRCRKLLTKGYDTVGCLWMTPERNTLPPVPVTTPFYGGNFWWATASYLRTLPPVGNSRHDAEFWIGLGTPRAYDRLPNGRIRLSDEAARNWGKGNDW
jgi:hypothetical protein